MANWCNVRLIVSGQRADVVRFAHHARLRPSAVFSADMLEGEAGPLASERLQQSGPSLFTKVYRFQARNDDGRNHFRAVSLRFPELQFLLVYFDPASGSCGSYLVRSGRSRHFLLQESRLEALMEEHGVLDEPDEDWRYWQASWAAMDIAETHWDQIIVSSPGTHKRNKRA